MKNRLVCEQCGTTEFYETISSDGKMFCSDKCHMGWRQRGRENLARAQAAGQSAITCVICKKPIDEKGWYICVHRKDENRYMHFPACPGKNENIVIHGYLPEDDENFV